MQAGFLTQSKQQVWFVIPRPVSSSTFGLPSPCVCLFRTGIPIPFTRSVAHWRIRYSTAAGINRTWGATVLFIRNLGFQRRYFFSAFLSSFRQHRALFVFNVRPSFSGDFCTGGVRRVLCLSKRSPFYICLRFTEKWVVRTCICLHSSASRPFLSNRNSVRKQQRRNSYQHRRNPGNYDNNEFLYYTRCWCVSEQIINGLVSTQGPWLSPCDPGLLDNEVSGVFMLAHTVEFSIDFVGV